MLNYVLRRILYGVPILIGVLVITFLLFRVVQSPETIAFSKLGAKSSAKARQEFIHKEGLDRSVPVQLGNYLWKTVQLDFGESWKKDRPVKHIFRDSIIPTMLITLPGFVIGLIASLALALYQVLVRNSALDRGMTVFCVALMSVPTIVYIIAGQWLVALNLNYFPAFGYDFHGWATLRFVALPIAILAMTNLGYDGRMFRAVFLEEISQDYVRTAQAKGVGTGRILRVHVLKNGMIAIITLTVAQLPKLILGSLLLESFFGIPGMGELLVSSVQQGDQPVLMASVFLGALLYIFALILTDVLYAFADPRIRLS
jgi:peptide/nickel transport system permease protein